MLMSMQRQQKNPLKYFLRKLYTEHGLLKLTYLEREAQTIALSTFWLSRGEKMLLSCLKLIKLKGSLLDVLAQLCDQLGSF